MQFTKLAVAASAAGALTLSLFSASLVSVSPAFADYAPSSNDVVGVGSDTVQYAIDFLADGDYASDTGYNNGQRNHLVNFDATPDANARLAYGSYGAAGTTGIGTPATLGVCTPGTGASVGTGNQATTHADRPCVMNPTIVLRAGTKPVMRPNGSGAGYSALVADNAAGSRNIDFARASSSRGSNALFDSVTIGTDQLAMLASTTTHSVALTAAQLKSVYECTTTDWSAIGGTAGTILPLLPQVGSGTRKSFITGIGSSEAAIAAGGCAVNVEENDPEAIDGSSSSINAIEPMSSGRLYMYKGLASDGVTPLGSGYFQDPSCAFGATAPTACVGNAATLAPNVQYYTSAGALNLTRNLYIYFRHADVSTTNAFQPGGTRDWVRSLFYNPCSGTTLTGAAISVANGNCTGGGLYGPGGAPFVNSSTGQTLVSAAGIVPSYAFTLGGA